MWARARRYRVWAALIAAGAGVATVATVATLAASRAEPDEPAPGLEASEAAASATPASEAVASGVEVPSTPASIAPLLDPVVPTPSPRRCEPEPVLAAEQAAIPRGNELARTLREHPERLGSASIGSPTSGALFGGLQLQGGEGIALAGGHPWGTASVIQSIERAVREVRRCYEATPKLSVGDISRQHGGWLRPHRSHQSGLDADLGYYYRSGPAWFVPATSETLDVERTWALVRALIGGGNVEYLFMDVSVQRLLIAHLETSPDDRHLASELFELDGNKDALIRHVRGHQTHFHVRFTDSKAITLGAKIRHLVKRPQTKSRGLPARRNKPTKKLTPARKPPRG